MQTSRKRTSANRRLSPATKLLSLVTFLFVCGCTTLPQKFGEYKEGTWSGKALVKDKKEGHNAIVNINVRAVDGQDLRLDITSPTGTHLGTVLMVGGDFQYMNINERTLYKSKSDKTALQSILRVPLEAGVLYDIFFDHAPTDARWGCEKDKDDFLKTCKDQKTNLTITWVSRLRDQRTIEIDHALANLQMSISSFEPKVADKDKAFELKVPSAFKTKKL